MKILVPLSKREYIGPYIEAGADEFYLGFHDEKWDTIFGKYADINRMSGFGACANPYSFQEIIDVIKEIKGAGKSVFITMNANAYSKQQIDFMEQHYFPVLHQIEINGLIFSDINAIHSAVKAGLSPVASTMCGIYNSDIAKVFYQAGVRRIILPRDLTLEEISCICSKLPDIHFEAFFMRNGCIFSDGYCLGMHRPECGSTCSYTRYGNTRYYSDYSDFQDIHDMDLNHYLYRNAFHSYACAMCALYRLKHIGITSLKIVGRADHPGDICNDIQLTKQNIKIMEACKTEQEYLKKMNFPENFPKQCRIGGSCYYPEVRFGEI